MSSTPTNRLVAVCRLLNATDAKYVVVGGFAVALHGVVRATKDIDILIEPTTTNADRVLEALSGLPWRLAEEHDSATIVGSPITIIGDDPRVDVLTMAWNVRFDEAAPTMLRVTLDDVVIPYADLDTLIRSKGTGRLQDRADIEQLERIRELRKRSSSS